MIRYSFDQRREPTDLGSTDNAAFFQEVAERIPEGRRGCGLLLVGGRDFRSLAVRRAQGIVRFDHLPSYWSHAALVMEWGKDLSTAQGLEVTFRPDNPMDQVPERNGVTWFNLAKFCDPKAFPNLAFIALAPPKGSTGGAKAPTFKSVQKEIERRAREPNQDRGRYAFLDWLGVWARFSTSPLTTQNPLLEQVPEPSAGFCEFAYEAAGIDLTPGATSPNACPELLWSTVQYWYQRMSPKAGALTAFKVVRDEHATPGQPLAMRL